MKEHNIGKLHEGFVKDHLNSAICSLASFEASHSKSDISKDFASKVLFFQSHPMVKL